MNFLDLFTLQSLAPLLILLGYAAWARDGTSPFVELARAIAALAAGFLAFVLVGNAVLHGHDDVLLSISRQRLYAGGFDGSSVFHAGALAVGIAIFSAGARSAPLWAMLLAAGLYGGLIAPVAMRQTWWGLLRSVGLIDTGGAIAIHLCGGAVAMALARIFPDRGAAPVEARRRGRRAGVALPLVAIGFLLLARGTAIMQSPATVDQAMWMLLVGAGAGAAIAAARAAPAKSDARALAWVVCGAIAGGVATVAGAGRLPWWIAAGAGVLAAAALGPAQRMLRAFFGERIDHRLVAAHLAGGLVAVVAAVPCAIHADGRVQVAIQLVAAVSLAGLATCAAVIVLGAAKLLVALLPFSLRRASPRTD